MRPLDWIVLVTSLVSIVLYGLYRGRGSNTGGPLPARRQDHALVCHGPFHHGDAGQRRHLYLHHRAVVCGWDEVRAGLFRTAYRHVVICTTCPLSQGTKSTRYEYLEKRFDSKTRTLASVIFLCQRGLSVGLTLYGAGHRALRHPRLAERVTTMLMGTLVITYTVLGG